MMNQPFFHSPFRKFATMAGIIALMAPPRAAGQELPVLPDAPVAARILSAQAQAPPPVAGPPQVPVPMLNPSARAITLDQALDMAKRINPTLQANQTLILQNKAQEITANLRPNPVISWDTQYLPLFSPSLFTDSNYWETEAQYDVGIGYLFERGKKRQHRLEAAKTATAVTEAQVSDAQRTVLANAAQLFVNALLAKSNLEFAETLFDSYKKTVALSEEREKAGSMSRNDLLKIQLQSLQFESDISNAELVRAQALASLRQFLGFDSVPADYEVVGTLAYEAVTARLEDLQARALGNRPDLQAAQRSVAASASQVGLAKANGKVDLNVTFDYTRLNQSNLGAFYFSVPLPVFNKNQGEIARTQYAVTQSQFQQKAVEQQVLTDVQNAYEALRKSEQVVRLFDKGYLDKATQSLDITQFSYEHGAASLLDFLDAERSFRATQLSYRQALAAYMTAMEQLRQAVGSRELQ
jgi:outer membrane protein, heavy metal efflux system